METGKWKLEIRNWKLVLGGLSPRHGPWEERRDVWLLPKGHEHAFKARASSF
jgi:hypothetical protein